MFSDPALRLALLLIVGVMAALFGVLVLWQPRRSFLLLLLAVVLTEQYPMAFSSMTVFPELYNNLNVTLGIGALKVNPLELILALVGIGVLFRWISGRISLRLRFVHILGLLYGGWMIFAVIWGIVNQGNWKVALWILRPVIYFLGAALFTEMLVETPKQARRYAWMLMLATSFKAAQIAYRHLFAGIPKGSVEAYGAHECTSFQLWTMWVIIATWFIGKKRDRNHWLWLQVPILAAGIVFNERRINIATLVLGSGLLVLMQSPASLRRRAPEMKLLALGAAFYLIVGWFGPENPITAPVKGIKQGIRAEIYGENTDNSSQYRKIERYNLKHTIRQYPLLGTGLGVRYLQLIPLDDLGFEYAVYISHNQILLVHSATGSIGYFIFLLFYCALVTSLALQWRRLQSPWQRALALAGALSIMNWLLVGYYDMQLFFFRNSIVMGVIVGLPAALERIFEEEQSRLAEAGAEAPMSLCPEEITRGDLPCKA